MKQLEFFLIFILALSGSIYSEDDIANDEIELSSESEPLALVAGCVNVVTGNYFQVDTDFHGNTIDPLKITRSYDSSSKVETPLGLGFCNQFPLLASDIQKTEMHSYAVIQEKGGSCLSYKGTLKSKGKDEKRDFKVDSRILRKSYTNTNGGEITGKNNLLNWSSSFYDKRNPEWKVKLGDGTQRFFNRRIFLNSKDKKKLNFPTKEAYLLTREIKPNGNELEFEYGFKDSFPYISKIKTKNRSGKCINELNFDKVSKGFIASSSCGMKVQYFNHSQDDRNTLIYVAGDQVGHTSYNFKTPKKSHRPLVNRVCKLQGYEQVIDYNSDHKVDSLKHAVGPQNQLVQTHCFLYKNNKSYVRDILGKQTLFEFDDSKRVTGITYYEKNINCVSFLNSKENLDQKHLRRDSFVWSAKNKDRMGWLKYKTVSSPQGIFYKKLFQCDDNGNVTREHLFGNVTGQKPGPYQDNIEQYSDHYFITRKYSSDGFNLLIEETDSQGLVTQFHYLPGTNLVTSIFKIYDQKIQERCFKTYDDNGEIIEIVEDDGSTEYKDNLAYATYRKISIINRIQNPNTPSFGKAETEEKFYEKIHERERVLITKTLFTYDSRGNCNKIELFNSSGNLKSCVNKTYDDQNHVIQEKNPLGDIQNFCYDSYGNRTKEERLSTGVCRFFFYNSVNKLVKIEERHPDGKLYIENCEYNALGDKVKDIDKFENETCYEYDEFGHNTVIRFPTLQMENGNVIFPVLIRKYNILGHLISEQDERGSITSYSRNVFGFPTSIHFPNGKKEFYEYYISGKLKKQIFADGTNVHYSYDAKGRILTKKIQNAQGEVLETESSTYKGNLLTSFTNAAGITTYYDYDAAARLVAQTYLDNKIKYVLDDLSRNIKVIRNERVSHYTYDDAGNVLSIKEKDLDGRVYSEEVYVYDQLGREVVFTKKIDGNQSFSIFKKYNSSGDLIEEVDREGEITYWYTDRSHYNKLNQKVKKVVCTDALGRVTSEILDVYGNVAVRAAIPAERFSLES